MIVFPGGILITETEHKSLLHVESDPEQWLIRVIAEKATRRKEALIKEWRPKLFADPSVTTVPATETDLLLLILGRPEYKTRLESDAEQVPPVLLDKHNTDRFNGNIRRGVPRDPGAATVRLLPTGITVPDMDVACILTYVQDFEDWVLGAVLGHINRGKKKLIQQYYPVLLADPSVTTIPANEEELLNLVTNRADYRTLVQQAIDRA